ncbi:hypothetical protein PC116_g23644 [Phytophthora cactorum]|nr:hypothetical protein Pcac1_g18990 [Phytophthora cactorum]KAG4227986.1 hypothetical protein PC116_g23644 [Phytophthora cactorum]
MGVLAVTGCIAPAGYACADPVVIYYCAADCVTRCVPLNEKNHYIAIYFDKQGR